MFERPRNDFFFVVDEAKITVTKVVNGGFKKSLLLSSRFSSENVTKDMEKAWNWLHPANVVQYSTDSIYPAQ